MKIDEVRELSYGKDRRMLIPVFKDESVALLQEFLSSEVKNFPSEVMDTIESAEKNSEKTEFAGNCCLMTIENNRARIECTIDDADIGKPVEMDLEALKTLVTEWIRLLNRHKKQKKTNGGNNG